MRLYARGRRRCANVHSRAGSGCIGLKSKWPHPLTPAEIGCFLSHKKCLEFIAQGEEDHAAVFEDDVVFGRDAGKLFTSSNWIPVDADIIKIETHERAVLLGRICPALKRISRLHDCAVGTFCRRDISSQSQPHSVCSPLWKSLRPLWIIFCLIPSLARSRILQSIRLTRRCAVRSVWKVQLAAIANVQKSVLH
ncbi:glycosyltransferase family 25 protein [Ochrobactrum tritici]|uniref:Glycosyltransferase family 25 protein n=1 Tax=Brucella tritici TaxID=94626 RepID=A0A7X6FTH2_9HYPH|nr:glycosyltransferase family 25 protein [Brucella tritici]